MSGLPPGSSNIGREGKSLKAITLWQPWASLLACGAKQYETRSWATRYRGIVAIHSAALTPKRVMKKVFPLGDWNYHPDYHAKQEFLKGIRNAFNNAYTMDIIALLKKFGLELPEDKAGEFDKEFRQSWKHHSELDGKVKELETANTTITELQKTVKGFDGVDVAALKSQMSAQEQKYTDDIAALQKNHQIEMSLMGAKARNVTAAKALLDLDKIKVDGGKLMGLDEQLEALKKDADYLFDVQAPAAPAAPPIIKGTKPMEGAPPPAGGSTDNAFNFTFQPVRPIPKQE